MRSLILIVMAALLSACSTTPSKNFPALKQVEVIKEGEEIPLGQELSGSNPRKSLLGAWYDGDLNLFLLNSGQLVLDHRDSTYKGSLRITHSTVLPEYGKTLNVLIEEGKVRIFWKGKRMVAVLSH